MHNLVLCYTAQNKTNDAIVLLDVIFEKQQALGLIETDPHMQRTVNYRASLMNKMKLDDKDILNK